PAAAATSRGLLRVRAGRRNAPTSADPPRRRRSRTGSGLRGGRDVASRAVGLPDRPDGLLRTPRPAPAARRFLGDAGPRVAPRPALVSFPAAAASPAQRLASGRGPARRTDAVISPELTDRQQPRGPQPPARAWGRKARISLAARMARAWSADSVQPR